MPMYQSMPGAAAPHLFNWPGPGPGLGPTLPGIVAAGFPPISSQGSVVPGMQPHGAGFRGTMLPGMGFPGMQAPMAGFPGLPVVGSGIPGMSPLGPGFSGIGVTGVALPGMPSPAVAGAQADDDYDT